MISKGVKSIFPIKNQEIWDRYKQQGGDTENLEEYIAFLGNIYCPLNDSNDIMGLNKHWKKNVLYFYRNF